MSLESMPVVAAPAPAAPPVKDGGRTAASDGTRFAELVGGLLGAPSGRAVGPAAGARGAIGSHGEDEVGPPAPAAETEDRATMAAFAVAWLVTPPVVGAPAASLVAAGDARPADDLAVTADADVGVPAVPEAFAGPPPLPASGGPEDAVLAGLQPSTVVEQEAPEVTGHPETAGFSSIDGAGAEVADAFRHSPGAATIQRPAPSGAPLETSPGDLAARGMAPEPSDVTAVPGARVGSGDTIDAGGTRPESPSGPAELTQAATRAQAQDSTGVAAGSQHRGRHGAVAAPPAGGSAPAPGMAGGVAPFPSAASSNQPAPETSPAASSPGFVVPTPVHAEAGVSEPRVHEAGNTGEWTDAAWRDVASAAATQSGGGGSQTSGRRAPSGEAARAAAEALLTSQRGARPAPGHPGMPPLVAGASDGLEARFQAWMTSVSAASSVQQTVPTASPPDVQAQVVKAIQLQWRGGVGEARVQLEPEHLGSITVSLRVEQGGVVASVRVASAATLDMIQLRQQDLRSALEAQGLQLDELQISLDPDDRRERPAQRQPESAPPPRRRDRAARFEIVV